MLVALEDLLSDEFAVLKTDDAEDALGILEREPDIAVVITDERMPRMTGSEFLARLGRSADALRILLTGFADLSAVVRSVNDGRIFAYVTKPWNAGELRMTVARAAEQCRLTRELAEERRLLRERTGILNAVLESVGDGVVVSDRSGRFLMFNEQAERLLGVRPSDTSIRDWARACGVYLPDETTVLPDARDPMLRGMSERTELEVVIKNRVTPRAAVVLTATPLERDGSRAGSVALLHDVTVRRRLERQLSEVQKLETMGELAAGVAHDFNNLLMVIQGCGEVVLQGFAPTDPRRADMDELLGAAQRATSLAKQLLALGRRDAHPKTLDLNAVLDGVERMLQRVLGAGIELVFERASELGKIYADPGQIEQVILNLVINARDAMPDGGTLTIRTMNASTVPGTESTETETERTRLVTLTVLDTGRGMDAETRQHVFEPFFTTKEKGKGSGLGLSTVYGIVRRSGGSVTLESEVGRGTKVVVALPRSG